MTPEAKVRRLLVRYFYPVGDIDDELIDEALPKIIAAARSIDPAEIEKLDRLNRMFVLRKASTSGR